MAQLSPTISLPFPTLTIKVKMPRAYGVRMRLVGWLLGLAGW
ncbi:MAG: hypothetical protein JWQ89_2268 [Devosia sp.]|nr:hypothetical protein [Devosia sp.]MDB5540541.1 hypothetical protein [Devosia sp.]